MSRMDEAMQELVEAVKFSEEYIRYQDIKNRVHNQPQLEEQIHAFRQKNYLLQNSDGNVDLYDATDKSACCRIPCGRKCHLPCSTED